MFANSKHEKAYQLAKSGQLKEALHLFKEALNESPENADIYSDRGVAYIHLNDEVNALNDFNKAVALEPTYSYRYSARAYARDYFGDTKGGVEDYEQAIALDPKDAVAHNNLGLLQEKLGYKQASEANFKRADKLAKAEQNLVQLMEELEHSDDQKAHENTIKEEPTQERKAISPEVVRSAKLTAGSEFKKLFTSKNQWQEFIQFIKNGFKLK